MATIGENIYNRRIEKFFDRQLLTHGDVADINMAVPLLSTVTSPKHLIADKAYDADSLRNWLKTRRIKAVIPSTATRTVPYPLDRAVYRPRNLIERLWI